MLNTVGFNIAGQLLQIVTLLLFKSFYLYLIIQAVVMVISNLQVSRIVDKMYPYLAVCRHEKVGDNVIHYMKKILVACCRQKWAVLLSTAPIICCYRTISD